jgi:preprotein translocase subunit Sec63
LTDSTTREKYLTYGHLDEIQQTRVGIALPSKIIKDEKWSIFFLFFYLLFLTAVIPGCIPTCSNHSQTTIDHLHVTTANRFFKAVRLQKSLNFFEIISFLSECHEFVHVINSNQNREDIVQLIEVFEKLPLKRDLELSQNVEVFCSLYLSC